MHSHGFLSIKCILEKIEVFGQKIENAFCKSKTLEQKSEVKKKEKRKVNSRSTTTSTSHFCLSNWDMLTYSQCVFSLFSLSFSAFFSFLFFQFVSLYKKPPLVMLSSQNPFLSRSTFLSFNQKLKLPQNPKITTKNHKIQQ